MKKKSNVSVANRGRQKQRKEERRTRVKKEAKS